MYVIHDKPTESLLGLITVIAGLIVYFLAKEPGRNPIQKHSTGPKPNP
jgi:hypothetical protein